MASASAPVVLDVVSVSKNYGARRVLDGVSFRVAAGERVALTGPSGSGKTTLLNCLGGIDRPDSGSLTLNGHRIDQLDSDALARLRREQVGTVFQFFHLLPTLTAAENIELPLQLIGVAPAERKARVTALLDRVGLGPRAAALPGQLSGGEQQRIAIARALVHRPTLILADEPTGNLDSASGENILRLLRELTDETRTALVLVSHFTAELPQIWFFHPIATYFGMDYGVPFPSLMKMAVQISIMFVLEDAWHYWFHRALHYGPLYKAIHKMHHTYSAPFGLAAEYASPIETMLLGLGTVGSPILICCVTGDLHLFTMYSWIVLRLFQAIDAHSGYDFPWSLHNFLPVWAGAAHHDVHHEKFIGNYASSFRWWDYCLDTEAGADAHKRRRDKKLAEIRAKKEE